MNGVVLGGWTRSSVPKRESLTNKARAFEAKIEEANLSDDMLSTNMADGTIPGPFHARSAMIIAAALNQRSRTMCDCANLRSVA